MPNWCENTIEITGKTEDIQRLYNAMNNGHFFKEVIPVPEDLNITVGFLGDTEKQAELERKYAENVKKHGFANWYDFCTTRWGTKWDADFDSVDCWELPNGKSTLHAAFLSAWSPPIGVYAKLVEDGFEVLAHYHEPGMVFAGRFNNEGDEYYEGWASANEAEAMLPRDIDEAFNIAETLRDWETENADE